VSFTGILTFRNADELRATAKSLPIDRLMIETDAPYLLPRTLKPKPSHRRNEPAFLAHICTEIAHERGEDAAVTAANSTATAKRFFRLSDTGSPAAASRQATCSPRC